ncbi:YdiU family protein [Flaviaesturariibacter flavus]|uniref:Protein nucleotidyltransferase YdiU n=1 Tax=Flaviaesturariibacter flavus TaxID=2502780 RepID=A0A4R1BK62_9BACT|nr:YdiU family protein [Flaviaesturariibacter flavus]TCJ17657.1 YdiU family protein [Flaviaesturariibacter flavus]
MAQLHDAVYRDEFVSNFKGDDTDDKRPRQTPDTFWAKAAPTPVPKPELLAWTEDLAAELGIGKPDPASVEILGGNKLAPGMHPYAACYAGHQFGNWAGQLGDGRAITLGEVVTPSGETQELQLKGAGPTAYSRRADGRAVLRSSVREYLMSEAMHHLGVPTTRALGLVTTGEPVLRDMFYDGHPAHEPGAIVARVAPSFLRFGNFEMPAARGELDNLRQLVNWTIARYFPQFKNAEEGLLQWFGEVVRRTAFLMAEWQRVGFVHGVMNTDNMSILGLTIDYGPYSFIDAFEPNFTPNTTDLPGRRYAFGKQPAVAKWNLGCLAGALLPLSNQEALVAVLDAYDNIYWKYWFRMMGNKLGLAEITQDDQALLEQAELVLATVQPDYTIFFQLLATWIDSEEDALTHFSESFYGPLTDDSESLLTEFLRNWRERVGREDKEAAYARMQRANPRFILRNYLLSQAIEGLEKGDDKLFRELEAALKEPYTDKHDKFMEKRPGWANQKAGCSMLSCSS